MKQIFLSLYLVFMMSLGASAQVLLLNDPHITAQQKRMVYASWGNFLPKPKYFLGIQTNIHYTMVWGWLAPSRNRSYRKGADIRPLGPTGEQTQRMLLSAQMLEISQQKKELSDSIQSLARSELYNYSALFAKVDPLWLLYYKKQLKPVLEFSEPASALSLSAEQLLYVQGTRLLTWYNEQMNSIRERLEQGFSTDMDRGARILTYHRLLLEYRALQTRWDAQLNRAEQLWSLKNRSIASGYQQIRSDSATTFNYRDQSELMRRILVQAATR